VKLRRERQLSARAGTIRLPPRQLALGVPETYMNDSGLAVGALLRRYAGGELARLVVVHDELDLEPGVVRVKSGGGTAGHNGLRSIESHLHSLDFVRVRIGIGKPPGRAEGAGHVLSRPSRRDREALEVAVELAADAVELLLERGVEAAMNEVNAR
jgi:PTH1 family peptidyl-tRNA hydrolase